MKDVKDNAKRPGRPAAVFYANDNLRRLYRERIEPAMTQKEFATRYKIGGQSMIAQILSGAKALPIETAPKIARALRCSIDEICPEMAEFIRDELLPNLGKALRRAAVIAALALLPALSPTPADTAFAANSAAPSVYYVKRRRREIMRRIMGTQLVSLRSWLVSACMIGAWLRRCTRLLRLRSAVRPYRHGAAAGYLSHSSLPSWLRNIPTSSRPYATQ